MPATDRATELDAMRGIAAFAVVVFHAIENLPDRDLLVLRVLRGTPLRPFLDGRQPVIFFFVLSGLVLTRALLSHPPAWFTYALRRITRLCLPTVAAVLLSAVLYVLCHTAGTWPEPNTWLAVTSWTRSPSAEEILRHISLTGVDGDFQLDTVLWTLVHELRLSLLLPLVIAFAVGRGHDDGSGRDQRCGLTLLMACSLLLGVSIGDHGLNGDGFGEKLGDGSSVALLVSVIYRFVPVAIFLWIAWCAGLPRALVLPARGTVMKRSGLLVCGLLGGIALGHQTGDVGHLMLGPSVARSFLATICFAPCFLLGSALSLGALDRFAPGPEQRGLCLLGGAMLLCFDNMFATAAASMLLVLAARAPGGLRTALRRPALVFLGRISFSLYLVHVPLLLGMSHGLHGILPMGAIIALWVPLTIPAAWILCRVVDEPAQRLARLFGTPKRAVPA